MKIEIDIAEHHYNNIMALDSVSLGRVPYKGIIMYSINAIKHGRVLEQEPTTENDLEVQKAIEIIKADSLAPYSVDDILKTRDLAVEALKQMGTTKNSLSAEEVTALAEWTTKLTEANKAAYSQGYADGMKAQEPIKALGEELRKARKGITDEKMLIGYNMAVAICNKHLGESEE